ncbi:MAG: PHP domain-containing protein [Acutalibacteraceae bacterium]
MELKRELTDYDIYPKVFPENTEVTIHIVPLGFHAEFKSDTEYTIHIRPLSEGSPWSYPNRDNFTQYYLKPDENGGFTFSHKFGSEQEYFIRIIGEDGKKILQLSVYALAPDLCGRYPFRGDLHMHTRRSDGKEAPAVVAANYRRYGYDFLAITDHQRYYPSLEAIEAFKGIKTDYVLVPGEEIHLPDNDVHLVSFGARYSINGLIETRSQIKEKGKDKKYRSLEGDCPEVLTEDEYKAEVNALIPTLNLPDGFPDKFSYASCIWIFNQIRQADGLGIFCHPYWISDVYQVPESFTDYMTKNMPFDAFEVAGGESYYEQNGFQWSKYYEDREKGRIYPIVGSTDSHGSVHNDNKLVACTIVFARQNERKELINSIKQCYSVAVDTVGEDKIIGEFRLVKYACFLMKNYFPLHDELCFEEGRALKGYACGDKSEKNILELMYGRTEKMRKKYFKF